MHNVDDGSDKLLVLVAENDPDLSKMWDIYIQGLGHKVIVVGEGGKVLANCLEKRPAAILLGKSLQGQNRNAVYEQLQRHADTKETAVIFMPPEKKQHDTEGAGDDQLERFLKTPFDVEDVKRFLAQIVSRLD